MGKKVKKVLNMPEPISDDSDDPDFDEPLQGHEEVMDEPESEPEPIAESSRSKKVRRAEVLTQAQPSKKKRKKTIKVGFQVNYFMYSYKTR